MTVLLIGGAYQGKRTLARRLFGLCDADFACGETCTAQELRAARAVDGLHRYVRHLLETGAGTEELAQVLCGKIILCDEIGCGVVPFERAQDAWREAVGRLCCELAARADLVVRVQAGLGLAIKGCLPNVRIKGDG